MTIQLRKPDDFNIEYLENQGFGFRAFNGPISDLRNLNPVEADKIESVIRNFGGIRFYKGTFNNYPRILFQSQTIEGLQSVLREIQKNKDIIDAPHLFVTEQDLLFDVCSHMNFKSPAVMGIVNVTPDSFSDGGKYLNHDAAYNLCQKYIEIGVDILDIGGESSRPGSDPVTTEEETERVLPLVQMIRKNYPKTMISVDTTKSEVAEKVLESGANIVNDISAGLMDKNMFDIIAKYDSIYIIMHMKGIPKTMQSDPQYEDVLAEVYDFFAERISAARSAGITKIILDPGIGFGKRLEDNINLIRGLNNFKSLGYPLLTGLSRKSFLGKILDREPQDRDLGSTVSDTVAVMNGASVVRTHNAENTLQLKKIAVALRGVANV